MVETGLRPVSTAILQPIITKSILNINILRRCTEKGWSQEWIC